MPVVGRSSLVVWAKAWDQRLTANDQRLIFWSIISSQISLSRRLT